MDTQRESHSTTNQTTRRAARNRNALRFYLPSDLRRCAFQSAGAAAFKLGRFTQGEVLNEKFRTVLSSVRCSLWFFSFLHLLRTPSFASATRLQNDERRGQDSRSRSKNRSLAGNCNF